MSGSKRKPADPGDLAPSMVAAHYAAETGCSFAAAAKRYGVADRQAVHDAHRRAFPTAKRKPGRRPGTALQRTHSIRVPGLATVRVDDVELVVFRAAATVAGESLAGWLRSLCLPSAVAPPGVPRATFVRALGRQATGMPVES